MGFSTGSFAFLDGDGCGLATQRFHDDENWNDDVISWIDTREYCDGYVSNDGSVATIHIRPGYTDNNVVFVKTMFGLNPKYGISEVLIVPFDGWEKELKTIPDEEVLSAASEIMDKYNEAFEELSK